MRPAEVPSIASCPYRSSYEGAAVANEKRLGYSQVMRLDLRSLAMSLTIAATAACGSTVQVGSSPSGAAPEVGGGLTGSGPSSAAGAVTGPGGAQVTGGAPASGPGGSTAPPGAAGTAGRPGGAGAGANASPGAVTTTAPSSTGPVSGP